LPRKTRLGFCELKEKATEILYHIQNILHYQASKNGLDIFIDFAILSPAMTSLATYLPYIQIILAILIIASVIIQQSDASSGGAFGGSDNWNAGYHTRRGFEKVIFNSTIVLGVLFAFVSLLVAVVIR
jgi:protein translocase SecG subunit